jgi:predicted nucleotidyltransferase
MDVNTIPAKYQEDIKTAASFLKNEGCTSIYLFGSLVTGKVHDRSDIDIGIKGLSPQKYFRVYSHLYRTLANEIDLVDFDVYDDFFALLNSLGEVVKIG